MTMSKEIMINMGIMTTMNIWKMDNKIIITMVLMVKAIQTMKMVIKTTSSHLNHLRTMMRKMMISLNMPMNKTRDLMKLYPFYFIKNHLEKQYHIRFFKHNNYWYKAYKSRWSLFISDKMKSAIYLNNFFAWIK